MQGKDKKETVAQFGEAQVKLWRRSYDVPPPPVELESEHAPHNDPKYDHIERGMLPRCECLKDTVERCLPFWNTEVLPALRRGEDVLVREPACAPHPRLRCPDRPKRPPL